MAFHILLKRCDECNRTNLFRRPRNRITLARALPKLSCPYCHPEDLKDVCISCRFPYAIVGHHAHGMCGSCNISEWRFRKSQALQNPPAA